MKKAKQYMLCFMFIALTAFACGCGNSSGTGRESASAAAESTGQEEKSPNGSSNGDYRDNEESTGVLDGVVEDVREGAENLKDDAERAMDETAETNAAH